MMSSFIGCEIEFGLLVNGLFMRFASSTMMIVMRWSVFDLVVLVFTVVFQCESMSLGMLSLWVNELQLVLVGANFDWVVKVLLIFLLNINWHGMVMDELHWLMRLCVLMIDMVMVFSLRRLSINMFTRMLVDNASKCDGSEWEKQLWTEMSSWVSTANLQLC